MNNHNSYIEIDLKPIQANYTRCLEYINKKHNNQNILACVIKADAYGLGAEEIMSALNQIGCQHFFTATIEEAIVLRKHNENVNIYVLSEFDFTAIKKYNLLPCCYTLDQIQLCQSNEIPFFIQINSDLNRLGVSIEDLETAKDNNQLKSCKGLIIQFADTENQEDSSTQEQCQKIQTFIDQIKTENPDFIVSVSSSGGLNWKKPFMCDMYRIGRFLYGSNSSLAAIESENIITLKSKILQIRHIKKGESVGYSNQHSTPHTFQKDSKIAIIRLGYGDGFHTSLASTLVPYQSSNIKIINISMDLTVLDISSTDLKEGDYITLIGANHTLNQICEKTTINPRQILASLTSRLPRIYK